MQSHVSVAKAGVDALSASTAVEFGPRGITSNIIAPGAIADTEGFERLATKAGREGARRGIPLGRVGTVRDIADSTVFLFSDAGSYVNGEVLVVDGGAWRTQAGNPGSGFRYPDFLLNDEVVTGVKGMKGTGKAKL